MQIFVAHCSFASQFLCPDPKLTESKDSVIIYDSSFTCHSAGMVTCDYLQTSYDLVNYFTV